MVLLDVLMSCIDSDHDSLRRNSDRVGTMLLMATVTYIDILGDLYTPHIN